MGFFVVFFLFFFSDTFNSDIYFDIIVFMSPGKGYTCQDNSIV